MSRISVFSLVAMLLISSASMAGGTDKDFDRWKARLRTSKVHVDASHLPYRGYLRQLRDAIRTGDVVKTKQFLAQSDPKLLKAALGHAYYFARGPEISRSALQLAVIFGRAEVVRLLLDFAGDHEEFAETILGVDEAWQSALQMAVYLNDIAVVGAFLSFLREHEDFSALVFALNPRGESVAESAQRYHRAEILNLLQTWTEQKPLVLPRPTHAPSSCQWFEMDVHKALLCALPIAAIAVACMFYRDSSKD